MTDAEVLIDLMTCEQGCKGGALAINGTVVKGACGGPYRIERQIIAQRSEVLAALRARDTDGR